jgi:hypothetical protein
MIHYEYMDGNKCSAVFYDDCDKGTRWMLIRKPADSCSRVTVKNKKQKTLFAPQVSVPARAVNEMRGIILDGLG